MNTTRFYAYVFRTVLDGIVDYETRLLTSRESRDYFRDLSKKFDYVDYFKQVL